MRASVSEFCSETTHWLKPPFFPGPFSFTTYGTWYVSLESTSKAVVAAVVASFLTWMVSRQGPIGCERGEGTTNFRRDDSHILG